MNTDLDRQDQRTNWDDIRIFLEVSNSSSLRAAAQSLRLSVNTIRARIARLEESKGIQVLNRTRQGISLTDVGRQFANHVRDAGFARLYAGAGADDDCLIQPGRLTIASLEGIGTSWLTPRVGALQRRMPDLAVNLQLDFDARRDRSHFADIGLVHAPPASPDLIVAKIATVHIMLFASAGYLDVFGTPRTADDLLGHRFIELTTSVRDDSLVDLLIGADRARQSVRLHTNSAFTQAHAAESGAGIALMPSYMAATVPALVPLDLLPMIRFPVSLYYHANARSSPAVRAAVDWLRESFDPARHPWFAEQFVHPRDFPPVTGSGPAWDLPAAG